MFGRIEVHRFAWSTMNGKISLAVTVEVERSEHDTTCHRLFENPRRDWVAVAHDDPGKTNIDGDELHVSFHAHTPYLDRRIDFALTYRDALYRLQCIKLNYNVEPRTLSLFCA
jgi:hypothetical protein